ncbi:MAG: TonB-dependent receptor [Novosphingobium sp.]
MRNISKPKSILLSASFIAVAGGLASPGLAQTVPEEAEEAGSEEEAAIIVTGSRIARPDLEASSPVAVIDSAQIKQTNAVTVEQILQVNPQFAAGFGQSSNNPGDGSATVNLRALEEKRTLVLVDGKRAPPYSTEGAVDVNSIPTALIKRVDVLTGGASAVYGSDAIAGVVNFVLDDEFDGITADASSQISDRGDGAIYNLSLTGGTAIGDRGNIVLSVGYAKRDGVFFGARPRLATALDSYDLVSSGGSGNTFPSAFDVPGTDALQVLPDGNLTTDVALYNFNPVNYAQSPFERWNVMALGKYEVSDGVEIYGRGTYSDVKVDMQLAPTATAGFPFNIDPSNPFLSPAQRDAFFNTAANPGLQINDGSDVATDPTARAGTSVVGIRRRMIESGGRLENFHTKNFQIVGGVRGDLGDSMRWDVFAQYGQSKKNSDLRNDLSYTALQQALDVVAGPGGTPVCANPAGGCVPLDVFSYNGVTPASLAFVLRDANEKTKIEQFIAGANLSGDLDFLQIPWANSPAAFSVGAEYRKEKGTTNVDDLYASGDLIFYGQGQDIKGDYDVWEIYGELKVPIIQDQPWAQSLSLELGGRYSDYSSVGSVWTYKAGGEWAPTEGVRFRGIYQRAVRAPNIFELYSPVVAATGGLTSDPCSGTVTADVKAVCLAQGAPAAAFPGGGLTSIIPQPISGQINIFSGGNPDLDAEKSDTYTLGVVVDPPQVPGLTASVDYFNIKIKGAIEDTPPFLTMAACYDNPSPTSAVCQSIVRNTVNGSLSGPTQVGVPSILGNVGSIKTDGIDFVLRYAGGSDETVSYSLGFAGTWTMNYKFQADPTASAVQCAGFFGPVCDLEPMPEWKHVVEGNVGYHGINFMLRWRYLGAIKADSALQPGVDDDGAPVPGIVVQKIPAFSYFDTTLSFDITEQATIRLGVLNLFDKKPPVVGDTTGATAGGGSTFPNTYDVLGRAFFAGVTAHF